MKTIIRVTVAFFLAMAISKTLFACDGKELRYYKRAVQINSLLVKEGARPDVVVIVKVLKEIDRNLVVHFPKGPFKAEDFIAIGMTESRLNPKVRGSSGERGIFQIMPYYSKGGNPADIRTNTALCFKVLKSKYRQFPDRRLAIIAYNGLTRRNGIVNDTYWLAFSKQRTRVNVALGIKQPVSKNPHAEIVRKLQQDIYGEVKS